MTNEYQAELKRIHTAAREATEALLRKARESGHFPDDPGYTDELGDPINRTIARAERKLAEINAAFREVEKQLFVETLCEPNYSF